MYTQEQLEGMSNQEIDQVISNIALKDVSELFQGLDGHGKRYAPYCSNWADMGPLIVEAGLCLTKLNADEWETWEFNDRLSYVNKNPLRAAAIVYILVMQERTQ